MSERGKLLTNEFWYQFLASFVKVFPYIWHFLVYVGAHNLLVRDTRISQLQRMNYNWLYLNLFYNIL